MSFENEHSIDTIVEAFIDANRKGIELRTLPVCPCGNEHFFYNPAESNWDFRLKQLVDESRNLTAKNFFRYFLKHPIKLIRGIVSSYRMVERWKENNRTTNY